MEQPPTLDYRSVESTGAPADFSSNWVQAFVATMLFFPVGVVALALSICSARAYGKKQYPQAIQLARWADRTAWAALACMLCWVGAVIVLWS